MGDSRTRKALNFRVEGLNLGQFVLYTVLLFRFVFVLRTILSPFLHLLRQTHFFILRTDLPSMHGFEIILFPTAWGAFFGLFGRMSWGHGVINLVIHGGILQVGRAAGVDGGLTLIVGEKSLSIPQLFETLHDFGWRDVPKFIVLQFRGLRLVLW